METVVKVMLSIFIVGLVVMTIVFFSIFGLLPAEKLTEVFRGDTSTSSPTIIISTTTVVERIIERTVERTDRSENNQSQQDQESGDQQDNTIQTSENGQTGDSSESSGPRTQSLPPAVFNTSGEVTAIQGNTIFVASDGSHMETIPAGGVVDVEVIVTDSTNILDNDNNEISFSSIEIGDSISVESSENIKNETQFEASNVKLSN